ncbi:MAG: response regulator [bacterium]|nr:response regulator [bacterium]
MNKHDNRTNSWGIKNFIIHAGLGRTLLAALLALAIIPVTVVSLVSYHNAGKSLIKDAKLSLETISHLKTQQIKQYFSKILTDLEAQTESRANMKFLSRLVKSHRESRKPLKEFVTGDEWKRLVDEQGTDLKIYRKKYDYYDVFLIDTEGNVLFTVAGERDLGSNLFEGPYTGSLFAAACRNSLKTGRLLFSDYQRYKASGDIISGFVCSVISSGEGDKIGLIAFRFPLQPVDSIMRTPLALGRTAETYLVGRDLKMRSNSILEEQRTALGEPVKTERTTLWKKQIREKSPSSGGGHAATEYDGPHGKPVLGVHNSIDIAGVPLGVMAEIETSEALADTHRLRDTISILLAVIFIVVVAAALTMAIRLVRPIRALSDRARRVAEGDLEHEIKLNVKHEIGELTDSFNDMINHLRLTMETNEAQNWLTVGQTRLNEKMRGEPDAGTLSANIISFLADYLNAQVAAIYMCNETGRLKMMGSYAYSPRKNLSTQFMPGEGLIGQAALEKDYILINRCPPDYLNIYSGLGEAVPANILVFPILLVDEVKGVLELGSFDEISEFHINFLGQVSDSIAIALNSVESRDRAAELLSKTQQQAEELQTQQEELRHSNEELESHGRALKKSEEQLLSQQEELRVTNKELEEKSKRLEVQKLNTDRKNTELKAAREELEEKARALELSSKYKSEFLSNMSHELRTPLNSILLLSRLLSDNKDGSLTDDHVETAGSIHSSGTELLHLINEILDLSKVEAGKMDLHIENVEIEDVSRAMQRHFQPLAIEKKITFNVDIGDPLPDIIRTDRQRLEQVIKNFLSNAFKFTPFGSITLRISRPGPNRPSDTALDPGNSISFSVIDTGAGIPKEKQKVIFQAFQQADGTTSRKYGGTGLGLSISRELAKLMGGEIHMKSTPGNGSTFTIILPENFTPAMDIEKVVEIPQSKLKQSPPPSTEVPSREEQEEFSEPPVIPGLEGKDLEDIDDDRKSISTDDKSILIIEDDISFLKILRDLSRQNGFKVLITGDGETGLQFAEYYKPSAIILDIGLPRIDGWAVMARLKENCKTRHIPVHFISASDRQLDAMKMGAVDFITKPVTPETLEQVYENLNSFISKSVKDLLIVESNTAQARAVSKLIGNGDVRVTVVGTAKEGYKKAVSGKFDCMIMDLVLPDMPGVDLLHKIRGNKDIDHLPIIIYTGRKLTKKEREIIDDYAASTIIKGAGSHRKLLAETTLFLHRVETNLPEEQQKMLRTVYDKETILAKKKVLVVDDDMRNVYSLKKTLEDKDMSVLVGRNGREGLRVLAENTDTHIVLMDIMMPEMDGYEAMREIRKEYRYKDIPIIALTAKAMRGDRAKCIQAGASDYLAKPVDTDRLFSMLRVWLY